MSAVLKDKPAVREKLVSADSHVFFTDDWVKQRLRSELRPVWDEARKKAALYNEKVQRAGQPQLHMEDFVDPEASRDPGYMDPAAKIKAMDRDGVLAEVIFPEVGGASIATEAMMGSDWKEVFHGYNQAMADFASHSPDRLLCAYQLPLQDVDFAISEVQRLAKDNKARCVQITPYPADKGLPDVHDKRYDRLWATIQETGLSIMNHLELKSDMWDLFRRDPTPQKGIFTGLSALPIAESICFWILTGTLERYPKLKVILVEPGLGWLPWFFDTVLDARMNLHYEFPGVKMKPSDYFRRQMGATFMYEPMGLKAAHEYFGADCLYWSTDFPHPATCWPHSQEQVVKQCAEAGISDADRKKIVSENALKAFAL
jgi:predicted TIM-barrel fold metal-dependent hydrolase